MNFDTTNIVQAGSRSGPKPPAEEPSVSLDEWPEYYEVEPPDISATQPSYELYLPVSIR